MSNDNTLCNSPFTPIGKYGLPVSMEQSTAFLWVTDKISKGLNLDSKVIAWAFLKWKYKESYKKKHGSLSRE